MLRRYGNSEVSLSSFEKTQPQLVMVKRHLAWNIPKDKCQIEG
jgi:hypothetical protein